MQNAVIPPMESSSDENSGAEGERLKGKSADHTTTSTYRDYSRIAATKKDSTPLPTPGGAAKEPTFAVKLHMILSNPAFEPIIAWLPHGRSWRILQQKAFEEQVIPLYFRHGRYSSFARQVNGWGFQRIVSGSDFNSYYHELFLRGLPHLCEKMRRLTAKDIAERKKDEDEPPPDFYAFSRDHPLPESIPTKAPQADSYTPPAIAQAALAAANGSGDPANLASIELAILDKRRAEILERMDLVKSRSRQAKPESSNGNALPPPVLQAHPQPVGATHAPPRAASQVQPNVSAQAPTQAPAQAPPAQPMQNGAAAQAAGLQGSQIASFLAAFNGQPAPAPPAPPPPIPQAPAVDAGSGNDMLRTWLNLMAQQQAQQQQQQEAQRQQQQQQEAIMGAIAQLAQTLGATRAAAPAQMPVTAPVGADLLAQLLGQNAGHLNTNTNSDPPGVPSSSSSVQAASAPVAPSPAPVAPPPANAPLPTPAPVASNSSAGGQQANQFPPGFNFAQLFAGAGLPSDRAAAPPPPPQQQPQGGNKELEALLALMGSQAQFK